VGIDDRPEQLGREKRGVAGHDENVPFEAAERGEARRRRVAGSARLRLDGELDAGRQRSLELGS
jgi:hypothetical protein